MDQKINCLLQVKGNRKLDLIEWIEYHIALGFNKIYVFSYENKDWLSSIVKKYNNVILLNIDEKWKSKKVILESFIKRQKEISWTMILEDNEFVYVDPTKYTSLSHFISVVNQYSDAVSLNINYISSKDGIKDRVGTQIDCFTHVRNPSDINKLTCIKTPKSSVVLFKVNSTSITPLLTPTIPVSKKWINVYGDILTQKKLELDNSNILKDPVRIYKFAIRSGIEMNFESGTKPVGYGIVDPSLQNLRKKLIDVPVNLNTEYAFAKSDILPPILDQIGTTSNLNNSDVILPITNARIDREILSGNYYEDVLKLVKDRDPNIKDDDVLKVFTKEREMIITSSPIYTQIAEYISLGKNDTEITNILNITSKTLTQMKKCLDVLDIQLPNAEMVDIKPIQVDICDDILLNEDEQTKNSAGYHNHIVKNHYTEEALQDIVLAQSQDVEDVLLERLKTDLVGDNKIVPDTKKEKKKVIKKKKVKKAE